MTPDLDGRGEGYGKYSGLTIAEIQGLFDTCVQNPSMRSISAVLRITREQLDARGQLGIYPVFAVIAALVGILGFGGRYALPSKYLEMTTKVSIGAGCVFLLLLVSVIPTRNARKGNLVQEKAIREASVRALTQILENKPPLKPLSIEQEFTVKLLLKKTSNSEGLRELL